MILSGLPFLLRTLRTHTDGCADLADHLPSIQIPFISQYWIQNPLPMWSLTSSIEACMVFDLFPKGQSEINQRSYGMCPEPSGRRIIEFCFLQVVVLLLNRRHEQGSTFHGVHSSAKTTAHVQPLTSRQYYRAALVILVLFSPLFMLLKLSIQFKLSVPQFLLILPKHSSHLSQKSQSN